MAHAHTIAEDADDARLHAATATTGRGADAGQYHGVEHDGLRVGFGRASGGVGF
jgi:hypothetical protein